MTDLELQRRIAALPPERRALFERAYAERGGPLSYELSYNQRGLWFIERLLPASPLYLVGWRCTIRGRLDSSAFSRAMTGVVARHEALRAGFDTVAGRAVQIIRPDVPIPAPVDDLRDLPEAERQAALDRIVADQISTGFDLAADPLIRVRLARLTDDLHVAVLFMHHLVTDGASTDTMFAELCALYEAHVSGLPAALAPPSLQYGDFVAWQRDRLCGERMDELVSYWRNTLAGAPGLLDIPTDRRRPAATSYAGAMYRMTLPPESTTAMADLAAAERCTRFMAYLTVLQALLARYAGRDDICVGTPVANRSRPEFASLVGFCVNVVVLRTDCGGDPTFRELLARARQVCLNAYDHEELPFEQLVEALAPRRSLSYNPLFQVACALDLAPGTGSRLGAAEFESVEAVHPGLATFDLSFAGYLYRDEITINIDYSTELFDEASVARLARHFRRLWDAAAAEPDVPFRRLPMLDPAEISQLTAMTPATPGALLGDVVAAHARHAGGQIALSRGAVRLSYAQLDSEAGQLAGRLAEAAVRPDAMVIACLGRTPELAAVLVAAARCGATVLLVPPGWPVPDLMIAIERTRPAALICSPGARSEIDGLPGLPPLIALAGGAEPAAAGDVPGPPVVLTASQLSAMAADVAAAVGLARSDRVAITGAVGSACLAAQVLGVLWAGAECVLAAAHDDPASVLADSGADVLWAASRHAARLPRPAMAGLRLLITDPFRSLPASVAGTTLRAYVTESYVAAASSGTAGTLVAVPGVSVLLLDDWLQLVPAGAPADAYLGGPYIEGQGRRAGDWLPGYVTDPRSGRWIYRTGDVMRRQAGGLEYLGRRQDISSADGGIVIPRVIEDVALSRPDVSDTAVALDPHDGQITLYVTGSGDEPLDPRELQAFLAEQLPNYLVPQEVITAGPIPVSADGTADLASLPGRDGGPGLPKAPYVAPRNALERVLVTIWSELLDVEQVGAEDNFFALGGHSLLAVKLLAALVAVFGAELPVSVLFGASTPADLAGQLAEALGGFAAAEQLAQSAEAILGLSEEEVQARVSQLPQ